VNVITPGETLHDTSLSNKSFFITFYVVPLLVMVGGRKTWFSGLLQKRQTFFLFFSPNTLIQFPVYFFFPHLTQIRSGVRHRKAIPNHIDKKGQSILQLQKYQNVNKVHLGVISMI